MHVRNAGEISEMCEGYKNKRSNDSIAPECNNDLAFLVLTRKKNTSLEIVYKE